MNDRLICRVVNTNMLGGTRLKPGDVVEVPVSDAARLQRDGVVEIIEKPMITTDVPSPEKVAHSGHVLRKLPPVET